MTAGIGVYVDGGVHWTMTFASGIKDEEPDSLSLQEQLADRLMEKIVINLVGDCQVEAPVWLSSLPECRGTSMNCPRAFSRSSISDGPEKLLISTAIFWSALIRREQSLCSKVDEKVLRPPLEDERIVCNRPPVSNQSRLDDIVIEISRRHIAAQQPPSARPNEKRTTSQF